MASRRPRCTCGDLFSEHDFKEGESPCYGRVCTAVSYLHNSDACDVYTPHPNMTYRPLDATLADFGLDRASYLLLLDEHGVWLNTTRRGPLGQAADKAQKAIDDAVEALTETEWLRARGAIS